MKKILLIVSLFICFTVYASDYLILAVKQGATQKDKDTINGMMQSNIDPQYSATNGVLWKKNGPPTFVFYISCYDVVGRNFPFRADNATAWIASHSAEFDNPADIIVLKSFTPNWGPYKP